jgi:hypothetical protein
MSSTDIPIKKHRPHGAAKKSLASGNSCMVGLPDADERPKPGSFPKALKRKALATNAAVPIVKPVCHSYGPPRDPPKDLDIDSEMPDAAVVRTNSFLFAFVS